MTEVMPQEIEVWDILPAIRRELAKILIQEHKLSQRDAARMLGLTDPAVSQYIKSKRAKGLVFGDKVLSKIKSSARQIVKDKSKLMEEIQKICNSMEVKKIVCNIHRIRNKGVPRTCKACLQ
jgi:hypothetical protein